MSTTTTNFGLFKPELTDVADITKMNPNWDVIDEELRKLADKDVDVDVTPEGIGAVATFTVQKGIETNGWFRIGTFKDNSASYVRLFIGGAFYSVNPEPYIVDVYHKYMNGVLRQQPARWTPTGVKKVRMVQIAYDEYALDIYCEYTENNLVSIEVQPIHADFVNSELEGVLENSGTELSNINLTKDGFLDNCVKCHTPMTLSINEELGCLQITY